MRVDCALLCDWATVREGLLHILGGGVTRAGRPLFPSPLGVQLAMRIVVHPTETDRNHTINVLLQAEDGERLADVEMGIGAVEPAALAELLPGEELALPVVVPIQDVGVPAPGGYSIEILIDNAHHLSVPFRILQAGPA